MEPLRILINEDEPTDAELLAYELRHAGFDIAVSRVETRDAFLAEIRRFLESRSPLFFVDRIRRPLLIGQGQHDPRVKQAESDQIVAAMNAKQIPVTYLLFTDEGHGFARPDNRFAFYAVAEAFLSEHLGGRYEPIGDAFRGAAVQVPAGRDGVPGLAEASGSTGSTTAPEGIAGTFYRAMISMRTPGR